MTPEQYRLYTGMQRLFRLMGTGGAAWVGVRGAPSGVGAPTVSSLATCTIRFMENNRVAERSALPSFPIYTADWWGLAAADVDIQAGDVYTNGSRAFLITGAPDTSSGFLVIPAATTPLPRSVALRAGAGYRAGLRIGAF